jgi:hypothetical protein
MGDNSSVKELNMGKLADNERIRLRAMFFNTLAAACVVTGLFVPYFVLLTAWGRTVAFFDAFLVGDWVRLQAGLVGLFATAVALLLGFLFRRRADNIARSMQD